MPARRYIMLIAAMLAIASFALAQTQTHEPYTIRGVQVRTDIVVNDNSGRPMDMGPNAFQQIAPCRLISTLKSDNLTPPFDGPAFAAGEARFYSLVPYLYSDNPCIGLVPTDAIAVALRVQAVNPDKDGAIYVTPGTWAPFTGTRAVEFKAGQTVLEEAAVMIRGTGFYVASQGANTDLTVDVLGFFIRDPHGTGPQGEKGDTGLTGEAGPKGEVGPMGPIGETGPAGPQGLKGETGAIGPKGETGATGPQGATGPAGPQGEMGAVGPRGPQGLQGPPGPQGHVGETGPQGIQGPPGPQGHVGETGPPGPVGKDGPPGPQGVKGDKGDQGIQGVQGPAGAAGPQGEQGPQGVAGPIGPQGLKGDTGPQGIQGPPGPGGMAASGFDVCIPHGGQYKTVFDGSIHLNSFIALTRRGDSTSNTFSIHEQGEGFMKISGQSDSCFNYAVFNP